MVSQKVLYLYHVCAKAANSLECAHVPHLTWIKINSSPEDTTTWHLTPPAKDHFLFAHLIRIPFVSLINFSSSQSCWPFLNSLSYNQAFVHWIDWNDLSSAICHHINAITSRSGPCSLSLWRPLPSSHYSMSAALRGSPATAKFSSPPTHPTPHPHTTRQLTRWATPQLN